MTIIGDFSTSVTKALDEIDPNWRDYTGLIVCGTHSPEGWDIKNTIETIQEAREYDVPFLGICFGLQLAVIEYAQNVWGFNANSTELEPDTPHPVVVKLPQLRVGMKEVNGKMESHWHNYAVNSERYVWREEWNVVESDGVIEIMELKGSRHHKGIQYHCEYESSKEKPHKDLVNFLQICKKYSAE